MSIVWIRKKKGKNMNNISKGRKGELLCKSYLVNQGYVILELNYRNNIGEIDIIAFDKKNKILAFIEVKTRTSLAFGLPCEAVNKNKQRKIINCSKIYINVRRYLNYQPRYDIMEVYLTEDIKINHIENAFC